jgi:hypothetical protein
MKNIPFTYILIILTIILMASSCNFPFQPVEPEVEIVQPTATIEVSPTSTPSNLERYASEYYSFTYPNDYTITLPDQSFPVLTVGKADNKRMEIFQMKDFGNRPWGFTGEETQEDIDGYVPKEMLTVGTGENIYDVWLFYSENDNQTIEELKSILDSIIIHN